MEKMQEGKAMGRGLRALLREDKEGGPDRSVRELESERRTRNIEFYASLLRKYVQTGEKDPLIEHLLSDIKIYMNIKDEDHQQLLETLRKRESLHRSFRPEEVDQAHKEIKEQLTDLFKEFRREELEAGDAGRSLNITAEGPQASPSEEERNKAFLKKVRKMVLPRDIDMRAGIINPSKEGRSGTLEWLEEGEEKKPLMMPSPKKGLDEGLIPIEMPPPQEDMEVPLGVVVPSPEGKVEVLREGIPSPEPRAPPIPEAEELIEELEGEEEEELEAVEEIAEVPEAEELEEMTVEEKAAEDPMTALRDLMEGGRYGEALLLSDSILRANPNDVKALNMKGILLYEKGDVNGSLKTFKHAMVIDPEDPEVLINYSAILSERGMLDEALGCIERALRKDPRSEEAWNHKAIILTKAGRLREALMSLDEALMLNEDSVETWTNTGIILEKMGEIGPAIECYNNILRLDPGNKVAQAGLGSCTGRQM